MVCRNSARCAAGCPRFRRKGVAISARALHHRGDRLRDPAMPSRLLSAFLVLALPLATVALVRNVPLIILPKALTVDMRAGCFVRDLGKPVSQDEIAERARIDRECAD